MTKRKMLAVGIILLLAVAAISVAESLTNKQPAANPPLTSVSTLGLASCSSERVDKASPVFETQDISRIVFHKSPDDIEVPNEYVLEIADWLGTFTIGEKVKDGILAPGSNSITVRVEYLDGTVIENGLSTIKIDGVIYCLDYEEAPECYAEIIEQSA